MNIYLSLLLFVLSGTSMGALNPCRMTPPLPGCGPDATPPRFSQTWELDSRFRVGKNPESVLADGSDIFVSTMGEVTGPLKNSDGGLEKFDRQGHRRQSFQIDGALHSPMGMAIQNEVIYVADIDRVLGFDTKTGKKQFEIDLADEKVNFLNDIVAIGEGKLIVSATRRQKLFLIDTVEERYSDLNFGLPYPNGLVWDPSEKKLYVVGNNVHELGQYGNGYLATVKIVHRRRSKVLAIDRFGHFLDGIQLRFQFLYISDWKDLGRGSSLFTYHKRNEIILKEQDLFVPGVADISLGRWGLDLFLPSLLEDEILIFRSL